MRNIDPYLLSKLREQRQTKSNNADPKLSIAVSRARTTVMDSTYWTVETIRTKEGLGDLSIAARRMRPFGRPDRLYNIYLDNGVVKTAIREYPSYSEDKWQDQFSLGSGKAVAIAFDGTWELFRDKWQLKTDELPWLFWVDNSNKLQARLWEDTSTDQELATSVSKVKAIRGWKNVNFLDRDHGIVVAYIKTNGKAYYRNYCSQSDGEMAWENEREITEFTGTAVNINLFITNDYRTGIMIEDSAGKIHWIISERNWAGMAIVPHYVTVAPVEVTAELIGIEYPQAIHKEYLSVAPIELSSELLFARTDNEILNVINIPITKLDEDDEEYQDWGWAIKLDFKYPIPTLGINALVATDIENSTNIGISSIDKVNDHTFIAYVSDIVESGINNILGDIKININNVANPAGYIYENMEEEFTPINLVPEDIPLPEVEAIWNE